MRTGFTLLGLLLLPVGIAGIVLPLLPGTPLLIAAAACFARSSPRLESYLVNHGTFGSPIRAWRDKGAIPFPVKLAAVAAMGLSALMALASGAPLIAKIMVIAAIAAAAVFVSTRPES